MRMSVQLWELQTGVQRVSLAACRKSMLCITAASSQIMMIIFRHTDHLSLRSHSPISFKNLVDQTLRSSSVRRTICQPERFSSQPEAECSAGELLCDFAWSSPHSVWTRIVFLSPIVSHSLSLTSHTPPSIRSSPPAPFSDLLSAVAPRPRHLSFKRFSLFSRLPGKLRHVWVHLTLGNGWAGLASDWSRCGFEIFATSYGAN